MSASSKAGEHLDGLLMARKQSFSPLPRSHFGADAQSKPSQRFGHSAMMARKASIASA
jgi:hypothetical protein